MIDLQKKRARQAARNARRRAAYAAAKSVGAIEAIKPEKLIQKEIAGAKRLKAKGYTLRPETLASVRDMVAAARVRAAVACKRETVGYGYTGTPRVYR